jgi:hypothetical protein
VEETTGVTIAEEEEEEEEEEEVRLPPPHSGTVNVVNTMWSSSLCLFVSPLSNRLLHVLLSHPHPQPQPHPRSSLICTAATVISYCVPVCAVRFAAMPSVLLTSVVFD